MKYDVEVFRNQYPIVEQFLRNFVCYRELCEAYLAVDLTSAFWTWTINAHICEATIQWCMVFGSDGNNPTHWKKLCVTEQQNDFEEAFRNGLYQSTDLTPETWPSYGEQMRNFRGQYVAHRELAIPVPVPDLDTARKVVFFYDKWIRDLILPEVTEKPLLEDLMQTIIREVKPYAMSFIAQTKLMNKWTEAGSRGSLSPGPW